MSVAVSSANNAIDRNITTCSRTDDIGESSLYNIVWWKVDLGGANSIYSIRILFKNYDAYDFGKNFFLQYQSFFMIQTAVKSINVFYFFPLEFFNILLWNVTICWFLYFTFSLL